jgi:hypothetical protein
MSRQCKTCGIEIDPRRIAILPHTQTCTQHSTAEKKVAVTVQMGEGDHTWIETYALDRADYDKMIEFETDKKAKPDLIKTVLDEIEVDEWDETLNDGLDEEDDDTWINVTDDENFKTWNEAPYGDDDDE